MTSEVNHDRSYWPRCGTIVDALPTDLNDLWGGQNEDQASVFVAEALIASPPRMNFQPDGTVVAYLWSVGGDTLSVETPLAEMITEMDFYDVVRSQAQADDVRERIAVLETIEATIMQAKERMRDQLMTWERPA
jgi:hypothetical protein